MKDSGGWVPPWGGEDTGKRVGFDEFLNNDRDAGPFRNNGNAGADARRKKPRGSRLVSLLVLLAMVAAAAGGFAWHRSQLPGGSALNCSNQTSAKDSKDYCYGGFVPLEPNGPRLSEAKAGPYFSTAVTDVYPADDALRLAVAGGDLNAIHSAATTAKSAADHAAATLAARTWPNSLDKPIRRVILEYQERSAIYANLTTNTNPEAIDWMTYSEFKPSGAQSIVRTALELDPEPAPAAPIEVTGLTDAGSCTGFALIGDDGQEVPRRCVTVHAVSHIPSDVASIGVTFNLLDADGTIRSTEVKALYSSYDDDGKPVRIHNNDTVTMTLEINPDLPQTGWRLALVGWSVHVNDGADLSQDPEIHQDDYTAQQIASAAVVNDFRFA
ncbi:hypothetical protein JS532_06360 [Bifidobacterium callimiconis]|uniref:hypothetical protein n=1 Tax=Bifidobacterium callimiconis TaxID=2306973 RepID=UPI001BDC0EDA|nr:hypothetical protein [Bifidobacterium callimiconis]MBT1177187.1 hypothetical protein [Bifidobacterium callimiconis]